MYHTKFLWKLADLMVLITGSLLIGVVIVITLLLLMPH